MKSYNKFTDVNLHIKSRTNKFTYTNSHDKYFVIPYRFLISVDSPSGRATAKM